MELILACCLACSLLIIVLFIYWYKPENDQKDTVTPNPESTTFTSPSIGAAVCVHNWEKTLDTLLDTGHEKKVVLVMRCDKCGTIDKTIETVKKECIHNWKEKESVSAKSAYEQMQREPWPLERWMFKKEIVKIFLCEKCGLMHEMKTSNTEQK